VSGLAVSETEQDDLQAAEASSQAVETDPQAVETNPQAEETNPQTVDVAPETPKVEHDELAAVRARGPGGPQVRTVDFSQPTKFTAELRRRVVRVLGPFCEAFALRLSTELRAPVELAVADSSQLTWSAAKAQLSANTIAVAVHVQPIDRQMLLCIEPPLVLQALECLLGGTAAQAPQERRLSEVDWALTQRLLQSMVNHLSHAWRDLGGLDLVLGEVDREGDAGVVAPIGEPTFALTLESRIDSLPSSMTLLIPWSAIDPVAEEILGGGSPPQDADSREARAMRRGLAGAHVCLRAEVGSLEMPVERMLALTPGTLLALPDRAEDGVQLFAEGVPLGRARPGLRGARRAVKLTDPIRPGASAVKPLRADPAASHPHREGEDRAELGGPEGDQPQTAFTREGLARMMGVSVRVWAELGRTTMALGGTLELPPGTVVELDQSAEAPIELFVNGMRFAHGTLQVAAEGEWAVQIDALA
jgi:flagellar motor switch protein FliM